MDVFRAPSDLDYWTATDLREAQRGAGRRSRRNEAQARQSNMVRDFLNR